MYCLTQFNYGKKRVRPVAFIFLFLTLPLIAADASSVDFFEKKIRPVLADNCYKCHSVRAEKLKGKLLVDSRASLLKGGESGPVLVPGEPEKSALFEAIKYKNKDLEMPPDGKLPDAAIADIEAWIKAGAVWPKEPEPAAAPKLVTAPENDKARREHWAFQPIKTPAGTIDELVAAKLAEKNLTPASPAEKPTLLRRAYFDLIGLPPSAEAIAKFVADTSPNAFEKVVDELLNSPRFGERWGRHWLDIARYAESSGGGRIRAMENAWRYRDYVINAFNADKPFDKFVREQIAGDLLPHSSPEQRSEQLIATGFLALGPKNLDAQDKDQLRMDTVDEQMDTACRVFLGLTPGCARCHDHKFDPLPTREYYSLAGIFKSTKTLTPGNVSGFVEQPLAATPAQEAAHLDYEKRLGDLEMAIRAVKHEIDALNPNAKPAAENSAKKISTKKLTRTGIADLPGIVVDDDMAKKTGEWEPSTVLPNYVGEGYIHDNSHKVKGVKGKCALEYTATLPKAGEYEVRFGYTPGPTRATNVPLTVKHAKGESVVKVDERIEPPIDRVFVSLGRFTFEMTATVSLTNAGTEGVVTADAVQFLPADEIAPPKEKAPLAQADPKPAEAEIANPNDPRARKKVLDAELKDLKAKAPKLPMAVSVRDEEKIEDSALLIRGEVHKPGEIVPRGFFSLAGGSDGFTLPKNQSGRVEFAEWLLSPCNPLTARVAANRVWQHLFGVGLARTSDNFGLAGDVPAQTQLLDLLATDFVKNGWSIKRLIREVMLSKTYQQSCGENAAAAKVDPENRLLWRMNRRRLEAEAIRDAMLLCSGKLDLSVGGPPAGKSDQTGRRSVYVKVLREDVDDCFDIFDGADSNLVIGNRATSNIATQALFLLNSPFVVEQAQLAAKKLLSEKHADDAAQIRAAYLTALGREPRPKELELAKAYLVGKQSWASFYQSLFACVDFRYLN